MDTLQLIDKVNSFYSNSFSQLITLTIAILGFSGVILPIVIQFIQTRIFRIEQKSVQSQISQEIQAARHELKKDIESDFAVEKANMKLLLDEQIKSVKQLIEEQSALSTGTSFFVQAKINLETKDYVQAATDYACAAKWLLIGKDDLNGQRAIDSLLNRCLPLLSSRSFDHGSDLENSIKILLKQLELRNENNRFYDAMKDITIGIANAKKRTSNPNKPA